MKWQLLNQVIDVKIVNIVEFGQLTIEKRIAHYLTNKGFILTEEFHLNALVKLLGNIKFSFGGKLIV